MRINLAKDPSLRSGTTTAFQALSGSTLSITDEWAFYGKYSLKVTKDSVNGAGATIVTPIPVVAGESYAFSMYARLPVMIPESDHAEILMQIDWLNSLGVIQNTVTSTTLVMDSDDSEYRLGGVWVAPAGATFVDVSILQPLAGQKGASFLLDALLVEQATYIGGYFDNITQAQKNTIASKAMSAVPQVVNGLRLGADVNLNGLVMNTIDEEDTLWVVTDIDGWWGQADPEVPDISRGTEDGSYDVEGRTRARQLTLTGFFVPKDAERSLTQAIDRLILATNLTRKGGWLYAHEEPTKAAWVRLSSKPSIKTVNARGRTNFQIQLRAGDPIKYHWDDSDPEGYTSNQYNSAEIPDHLYTNLITNPSFETYSPTPIEGYRNFAINPSFETGTGTINVRQNLYKYPADAPTGTAGWTAYRTSVTNPGGYLRGTVTEAAAGSAVGVVGQPSTAAMVGTVPGDVWRVSGEVRASGSTTGAAISVQFYDSSLVFISGSQTVGDTVYANATAWKESSVTVTAPAGAAYFRALALKTTASIVGDVIDVRRITAEKTPSRLGPVFTGNAISPIRINYNNNPRMDNNTSGWSPNGSGVTLTATPSGTQIDLAEGRGASGLIFYQTATPEAKQGEVWSGSIEVSVPAGFPPVSLAWTTRGYTGGTSHSTGTTTFSLQPGETKRISATSLAFPAGTDGVRNWLSADSAIPVGARIIVRRAILELAPVAGFYFDGIETISGYTTGWSGTANASPSTLADSDSLVVWTGASDTTESILTATGIAGLASGSNTTAGAYQSSRWVRGGTRSLRLTPRWPSRGTGYVDVCTNLTPQGLVPGNTYTILISFYQEAPQDFTGFAYQRAVALVGTTGGYDKYVRADNVAGEQVIRMTFTVPPTGAWYLRLYHGGMIGDPDIFFDRMAIVNGTYMGSYFDGFISPDSDFTPAWSGGANNSASTLSYYTYSGVSTSECLVVASTQWSESGTRSVRIVPTGNTASYFWITSPAGLPSGGTVLATTRLTAPITGATAAYSRAIRMNYSGGSVQAQAPNTAGVHKLRLRYNTQGTSLILGHGGVAGSGDIWFDNLLIIAGDYEDEYFDGNTPNTPGVETVWSGAPNASTSFRKVWDQDVLENIGTAEVTGLFTITGPAGAGTSIHNASTDQTMTLQKPLRGAGLIADAYEVSALNGVATIKTTAPNQLRVGDEVALLNMVIPFSESDQTRIVTAVSDVFPYSFSVAIPTDDIDPMSTSGQIRLANNDVLVVDTYNRSVTYNGEVAGHRSMLTTLTDWIKFAPGDNVIQYFDDVTNVEVVSKALSSNTVTLETADAHFLILGEQATVQLPTQAVLSKKKLESNVVTLTTAEPHGYAVGDVVDVQSTESSKIVTKSRATNVATLTTEAPHGVAIGDSVVVALPTTASPSQKSLASNTATLAFQQAHGYSAGDSVTVALPTAATITNKQLTSNQAILTTSGAHLFAVGDSITVTMPADATVVGKARNGTQVVLTTGSTHGFSVGDQVVVALPTAPTLTGSLVGNGTNNLVTVTTTALHGFSVGDRITVSGSTRAEFNGEKIVETIPNTTQFTFRDWTLTANLSVSVGSTTITNSTNESYNGTKTVISASGTTFAYNL